MKAINRKTFFDNYRKHFGKLNQSKADAVNFLLAKLETSRFKLPAQISYILATIYHETNGTMLPVIEGYWITQNRKQKLYNYYKDHNPGALRTIFPNVKKDQNGKIIDFGLTYEGAGFTQLTHDFNYDKFGIKATPEKAMEPVTAFRIMEIGLANGMFTGKKLQDYVNETKTDLLSARKTVNGMDRASLIAGYATKILQGIKLVDDNLAMQAYKMEDYLT